jgi:outer membrane murein-binding lipoprotein Lpp
VNELPPKVTEPSFLEKQMSLLPPKVDELTRKVDELPPKVDELTRKVVELPPRVYELPRKARRVNVY